MHTRRASLWPHTLDAAPLEERVVIPHLVLVREGATALVAVPLALHDRVADADLAASIGALSALAALLAALLAGLLAALLAGLLDALLRARARPAGAQHAGIQRPIGCLDTRAARDVLGCVEIHHAVRVAVDQEVLLGSAVLEARVVLPLDAARVGEVGKLGS